jgi:DNA-binding winged helix-turn-helix (wHTH) protein
VIEIGTLRLDPASRRVWLGDVEVELSAKEFAILESFMRRPDQALTRAHLVAHAWDSTYEDSSNIIDIYVRRLRKKLDEPFGTRTIETVRGAGYRLRADGGSEPDPDPAAGRRSPIRTAASPSRTGPSSSGRGPKREPAPPALRAHARRRSGVSRLSRARRRVRPAGR